MLLPMADSLTSNSSIVTQSLQLLNVLQLSGFDTGNSCRVSLHFTDRPGCVYEVGNSTRRITHVNLNELSDSYMNNS
jgi:hypothetical protein